MSYLHFTFQSLVATYVLWIVYIAIMGFKRAKDAGTLSATAKALGYPWLIFGYLLDGVINFIVLTVLLIELPRELTVTARLKRHNITTRIEDFTSFSWWECFRAWFKNVMLPWRKAVVCWAKPLLDPFDPSGTHI